MKKGNKFRAALSVTSSFVGTPTSTSAVVVATTVLLAGVAIPLAVISGSRYVSAIAITALSKKVSSKRAKHLALAQLAKSSSLTLSKYVSKVKDDGKIDEREFEMVCKFIEDYYQQKKKMN